MVTSLSVLHTNCRCTHLVHVCMKFPLLMSCVCCRESCMCNGTKCCLLHVVLTVLYSTQQAYHAHVLLTSSWGVQHMIAIQPLPSPAGLLQKKSQEGSQTTMEATLMAQQTPAQREQVCALLRCTDSLGCCWPRPALAVVERHLINTSFQHVHVSKVVSIVAMINFTCHVKNFYLVVARTAAVRQTVL